MPEATADVTHLPINDTPRKVLYVAGAGRSGTSTLAGIASLLGVQVPQPEVVADDSNPKGFGEPQWAVDFHDRLLSEADVQVSDSRPAAWRDTARICERPRARRLAAEWLEGHLAEHPELVVKDPRLGWFLPLWQHAAEAAGAMPVFATMLRPPAEVVGSKQKYYENKLGAAHLGAGWVNMLLHTEWHTRGQRRVFVRYPDLLTDWRTTTLAVGERLQLRAITDSDEPRRAVVDDFIDPSLRRVTTSLADLGLPTRLFELIQATWGELNLLADSGPDDAATHRRFDELRDSYAQLYAESEAIARSTAVAARVKERRKVTAELASAAPLEAPQARVADLIPHRLRAMIPSSARRGLRSALGRRR